MSIKGIMTGFLIGFTIGFLLITEPATGLEWPANQGDSRQADLAQTTSRSANLAQAKAVPVNPPSPLQWHHQWAKKNPELVRRLSRTILAVDRIPKSQGLPRILAIDDARFNEISWPKIISQKDFDALRALNQNDNEPAFQLQAAGRPQWLHLLLKVSGSHFLLYANHSNQPWNLYTEERVPGSTEFKPRLIRAKPPDQVLAQMLHAWIATQFGYDGLVLDQRNQHILIALTKPQSELAQGFVIADSDQVMIVDRSAQTPAALFQIRHIQQEFAIAEILLQKNASQQLTPGTKVMISGK